MGSWCSICLDIPDENEESTIEDEERTPLNQDAIVSDMISMLIVQGDDYALRKNGILLKNKIGCNTRIYTSADTSIAITFQDDTTIHDEDVMIVTYRTGINRYHRMMNGEYALTNRVRVGSDKDLIAELMVNATRG